MIHRKILIPASFHLLSELVWEDLHTFTPM